MDKIGGNNAGILNKIGGNNMGILDKIGGNNAGSEEPKANDFMELTVPPDPFEYLTDELKAVVCDFEKRFGGR